MNSVGNGDEDQGGQATAEDPKKDFEARNLEKLRAMEERRQGEKKMIEEERVRVQKRQEKLKNAILKQAVEYKEKKA